MKVQTNLFDITKSLFLVALTVFAFVELPKMFNGYDNDGISSTEVENIASNVAMATIAESTKTLNELIKSLKSENSLALETIKANNERIDALGEVTTSLSGKVDWMAKSDTFKDPDSEGTRDLEELLVNFNDADGDPYPVATVRLSPELDGPERWSVEPHKLVLKTNIIETTDDDGNPKRYAEAWVENRWSSLGKKDDGTYKHFPVDLTIENWAVRERKTKRFWYSPRIGFTGLIGQDASLGMHLGLFSYGKTKADSDWQFMALGVSASDDDEYLFFTPVKYNVGKPLPLMDNLFLGPTVYMDNNTDYKFGVSISTLF